jgi:hypothetical protein
MFPNQLLLIGLKLGEKTISELVSSRHLFRAHGTTSKSLFPLYVLRACRDNASRHASTKEPLFGKLCDQPEHRQRKKRKNKAVISRNFPQLHIATLSTLNISGISAILVSVATMCRQVPVY